jgi:hypothetical protein
MVPLRLPLFSIGIDSVSFASEFSPNFDLKNMISTYTKDFALKNGRHLPNVEE